MKNYVIYLRNLLFLILKPFSPKINLIHDNELVNYILATKKSVIRFGDGEYRIMFFNKGIDYQKYTENLKKDLIDIFKNYSNDKFIICIPPFFNKNLTWFLKNDSVYLSCFSIPRYLFLKKQKVNMPYGDAFLFKKGNEHIYSRLWQDQEKILLIHNDIKWKNIFEMKYNKNIKFIKIDSTNAYESHEKIIDKILSIENIKNYLVLVSAGPTAKVIAYKLSQNGIWTLDTGHCFDDPLV